MWSLTKPSGTMTTALMPSAGSSAMRSLMSGSSHGIDGGPERDWKTRSHPTVPPVAACETTSATARCCAA